ncbi:MAG TPA: hypothetical protein VMT20_30265 [Terriglobia bacterium]|nr:hypothetical protein [Terriglobia bacterium]
MLDLAISIDADSRNTVIVETNHGARLKAPEWPGDCDFQVVAFDPSAESCEVVWAQALAEDIGRALTMLRGTPALRGRKPDWYRRLQLYAKGDSSARE